MADLPLPVAAPHCCRLPTPAEQRRQSQIVGRAGRSSRKKAQNGNGNGKAAPDSLDARLHNDWVFDGQQCASAEKLDADMASDPLLDAACWDGVELCVPLEQV